MISCQFCVSPTSYEAEIKLIISFKSSSLYIKLVSVQYGEYLMKNV
jgi:hypothetical protein